MKLGFHFPAFRKAVNISCKARREEKNKYYYSAFLELQVTHRVLKTG
jgi:hypothetical protein